MPLPMFHALTMMVPLLERIFPSSSIFCTNSKIGTNAVNFIGPKKILITKCKKLQ